MSHLFCIPVIRHVDGSLIETEEYFPHSDNRENWMKQDVEGHLEQGNCVLEGTISYDYRENKWSFEPAAKEECTVEAILIKPEQSSVFVELVTKDELFKQADIAAMEGVSTEGAILHENGKFEYSDNVAHAILDIEVKL